MVRFKILRHGVVNCVLALSETLTRARHHGDDPKKIQTLRE